MPVEADLKDGDKWEFDGAVADVFDDMLARSIPGYEEMRRVVFEVGCRFVAHQTPVIDLGCSRGEALAPFAEKFGAYNTYRGVETSEPMALAAEARFAGLIKSRLLRIDRKDLRQWFPPELNASLVLSVLTLQFVPITYRQGLISKTFDALRPGGGFVLVEKVMGSDAAADALLVDLYHARKAASGYSGEQIARKAAALEGVLVPLTAAENERMLRAAGFTHVECVWRTLSFAAWVAAKPGK